MRKTLNLTLNRHPCADTYTRSACSEPVSNEPASSAPAQKNDATVTTLPVNLLLQGRPCLVVGAGRVAARKAAQLLESGAAVHVVGAQVGADVRSLATRWDGAALRVSERVFCREDVDGMFLVCAATDDAEANRAVLEACRSRGILCTCVDFAWREGDLISPAVLRYGDGLTVSVSTGGRSHRRARLVRDSLARHLEEDGRADLLVIGASHRELPLTRIESILRETDVERSGRLLRGVRGLHEFMILRTCNRVEMLALASADGDDPADLMRCALGLGALSTGEFYMWRGTAAFEHSVLLCAGLLSQTVGEYHIVSQVKEALAASARQEWVGPVVKGWMADTLHVSKEIRAAMGAHLSRGDVEERILGWLEEHCPGFRDRSVVVVGTGTVGRRCVELLIQRGGSGRICWCYRSLLPELPPAWQGRVVAYGPGELAEALAQSAYVITAAGGAGPVLRPEHAALMGRDDGRVVVIDAGMPRNVDPALAAAEKGIELVNLDDLARRTSGVDGVAAALTLGREIVAQHGELYDKIIHTVNGRHAGE